MVFQNNRRNQANAKLTPGQMTGEVQQGSANLGQPPAAPTTPQVNPTPPKIQPPKTGGALGGPTAGPTDQSIAQGTDAFVSQYLDPSKQNAADQARLTQEQQMLVGQNLADSRAAAGRSGLGVGAQGAAEGDVTRKAQMDLADEIAASRNQNVQNALAAGGLGVEQQGVDARNAFLKQLMAGMPTTPKPTPGGGQPGSPNPMAAPANSDTLGAGGKIDQAVSSMGPWFGSGGSIQDWLKQNMPWLT